MPDGRDKGIELSLRNWDSGGDWTPLAFYFASVRNPRPSGIRVGDFSPENDQVTIRGHIVKAKMISGSVMEAVEICDEFYLLHGRLQLRWLQTSLHPKTNGPPVDVWVLDDVEVIYFDGQDSEVLLCDDFEYQQIK